MSETTIDAEYFRDEPTDPALPAPPLWAQYLAADMRAILGQLGDIRDRLTSIENKLSNVDALERRVRALEKPLALKRARNG